MKKYNNPFDGSPPHFSIPRISRLTSAVACAAVLLSQTTFASERITSPATGSDNSSKDITSHVQPMKATPALASLAPVLKMAMPAIVNISVQGELPALPIGKGGSKENDELMGARKPRLFSSIGSGVIIDARRGYVLTNAHVIKDAKLITVTLNDGRVSKAQLVGSDPLTDVALIKIAADNLRTLTIADSDDLSVGDFVVAIGNPFGLNRLGTSQSATFGIISALQRSDLNMEGMENFIQTDAAINPGNSGGALVDMQGRLIGINTMILSPGGIGNIGIGFAIPINMARSVAEQIIKFGSVRRGMMGVFVQQLTPELAEAFGVKNIKGAIITQINPGSPADKAGLKPGDIITGINDHPVNEASQVKNIIGLLRVNSDVNMSILRDGKPLVMKAKITDARETEEQNLAQDPFLYGLALSNLDQESPVHGHVSGTQIVGASETSPSWRAGLRPGDVIIGVNRQSVHNIKELQEVAKLSKDSMLVHILRGSGSMFILVK